MSLKKLIKLSLLLCLFLPLIVFANVKVSFDDAKWSSNTYITQFKNYRWYIDFNTKKKYAYDGSSFQDVSGFDRGGLINLNEYKISLEDGKSYLKTVRPYWTMTFSGSNIYSINDGKASLLDRTSVSSGVRPTEYIIHQTEVTGMGSYKDPWRFVKPDFYVDVEYNSPQIKRNGTGVKDTAVEYGDIITYSIGLKNNGVKDSVINIREVALISALNNLVKLKNDSDTDVLLEIGGKKMSFAEAKAAANALLSDGGYTVTIAPGQELLLEFNVVIIGNAGDVIHNQLLYVMDGLEADPGVKNSMNIEKVVQYTEVAETGANVVLALDNSGSMGPSSSTTSKISKLKEANQEFLDIMLGENSNDNNEVCVVIMPNSTSVLVSDIESKCSKNYTELLDFSNSYLNANGSNTPFTNTFTKTYNLLTDLKSRNKLNTNFAMFLSDGTPVGDSETNYVTQANNIKSVGEFFTVGFETGSTATTLLKKLATDPDHYFDAKTTNIEEVFKNIAKRINEKSKRTTKGVLAISKNIDKTKNLVIEVTSNGTTTEMTKSYADALNESYIISKGSRYEINIKKFKADEKISVTYFLEKN